MLLGETLKDLGGVGAPVKVGFESSYVYAGLLCENYEKLFYLMYVKDIDAVHYIFRKAKEHFENFDEYWDAIREKEIAQKRHDLDYPLCCEENRKEIEWQRKKIEKINENIRNIRKEIMQAEVSATRKYLYGKIHLCDREKHSRIMAIKTATDYIKEHENVVLSEAEIEKEIQHLEQNIEQRKYIDYRRTVDRIERCTTELEKPPYLEREVLEVYDSVSPDELGTKIVIADGIKGGAYWTCNEMARDSKMQKLIESVG